MMKPTSKSDSLIDVWRSADEFGSVVEYRITKKRTGYAVVVCNTSDGELADVFEQKWDPVAGILSFAAHWNSTGRFSRCRLQATSKRQIDLIYTYTDTEVLIRSNEKKA